MNNNINIETKKDINRTILVCAMMIIKPKEGTNKHLTVDRVAENNYEYVDQYMTLEQFKCYIQSKVNIITADIF